MNKDKEAALLLVKLVRKMEELPSCCKVYQLNQIIYKVDMNIEYNEIRDKCYCFIEVEN